ncbi:MAG: four-carbon acid sugar kinase family protein, partial [Mesorhizobium sp.]
SQTIYCPAFPENGRAIFMGNLFVGEQPLSESSMKDHPLTPMRDSNLMRILRPQVTLAVGLANRLVVAEGPQALRKRLAQLHADGVSHVVIDAVANNDLHTIGLACHDMTLLTGGSAVAMPLPQIWLDQGLLSRDESRGRLRAEEGTAVVLSGSCSAMTTRQVSAYLAQNGPNEALDWLSKQAPEAVPIVYATAAPGAVRAAQEILGVERASMLVEQALAACAVKARDLGARRY